jgi:hypothetical protein
VQRSSVVYFGGSSFIVRVSLAAAVHGTVSPGGDCASLIVTDFKFESMRTPKRLQSFMIEYTFEGAKPGSENPVVVDISPSDDNVLEPTTELWFPPDLSSKQGNSGLRGYRWNLSRSNLSRGVTLSRGVDNDRAMLSGYIEYDAGSLKANSARWLLKESKDQPTRVPTFLRTAILLEHKKMAPEATFRATIKINARFDSDPDISVGSQRLLPVERMFGKTSSQIIFKPRLDKKENESFDDENLDNVDLDSYSAVMVTRDDTDAVLR